MTAPAARNRNARSLKYIAESDDAYQTLAKHPSAQERACPVSLSGAVRLGKECSEENLAKLVGQAGRSQEHAPRAGAADVCRSSRYAPNMQHSSAEYVPNQLKSGRGPATTSIKQSNTITNCQWRRRISVRGFAAVVNASKPASRRPP
eukprot:2015107-Amphidinium_carterae.2